LSGELEALEVVSVTFFSVFLAVFLTVSPSGTCCGRPAPLGCGWVDPDDDELLLPEDWLFGWDEDELLDPLEELGWLPPPPTLGGAGALGVGTEGGGTEGACTEGVGTDGVGRDGASTDGDPPEGHETVATGVWTQSWARTGKTAAAKAAIAIALPMSRALLFMPAASPPYRFLATAANRVRRYRNLFRDAPAPGTWSWVFERGWFSVGGFGIAPE
jgi:hypothetical protein